MRFSVTQTIDAPVERVAEAYASEELYSVLDGDEKLGRPELLDRTADGARIRLRIRYRFVGELSPAVTAVVQRERLSWIEESVHDLAARSVEITLHPDHYPDRLTCSGVYRYEEKGAGTLRRIEGDLRVKALLVAGSVERAIISGLKEHLDSEAADVEAFLQR